MNSRDKFTIGDRVRMTQEAGDYLPQASDVGVVIGFGRSPFMVIVLRDGRKTRVSYHMDFWERMDAEAADPQPLTSTGQNS